MVIGRSTRLLPTPQCHCRPFQLARWRLPPWSCWPRWPTAFTHSFVPTAQSLLLATAHWNEQNHPTTTDGQLRQQERDCAADPRQVRALRHLLEEAAWAGGSAR
ncbi:unnamed protein product [Prorocentrum cordatum]|uniref:Uncharacterized protein n=1 Tax=Prorocentrum cordatum TaxID=2364126 RepID=A0ABN9TR06_9DINO|nr:unnamed protein product [Polarella glacialis]